MIKQIRSKQGFALIESAVIVAVIGVILAIAIPQYAKYSKQKNIKKNLKSTVVRVFPEQHKSFFERAGISIDDYCVRGSDSKLYEILNKPSWIIGWNKYGHENPKATKDDVMGQMKIKLLSNGFFGCVKLRNYETKKISGYKVIRKDGKAESYWFGISKQLIVLLAVGVLGVIGMIFVVVSGESMFRKILIGGGILLAVIVSEGLVISVPVIWSCYGTIIVMTVAIAFLLFIISKVFSVFSLF